MTSSCTCPPRCEGRRGAATARQRQTDCQQRVKVHRGCRSTQSLRGAEAEAQAVATAPGAQAPAVVLISVVNLSQHDRLRQVHVRQGGCRRAVVRGKVLRLTHSCAGEGAAQALPSDTLHPLVVSRATKAVVLPARPA